MRTPRRLPAAKTLRHRCSECGAEMTGTGTVVHQDDPPAWFAELWCPVDREIFTVWTPQLQSAIEELLEPPDRP